MNNEIQKDERGFREESISAINEYQNKEIDSYDKSISNGDIIKLNDMFYIIYSTTQSGLKARGITGKEQPLTIELSFAINVMKPKKAT